MAVPADAGVGPHYPDFDVRTVSENHIIVAYRPILADDLSAAARTETVPFEGREVMGRAFLVSLPPDGEFDYSFTFVRAGTAAVDSPEMYVSENTPLVARGPVIEARGHRLARLIVFPQRLEGGRLAVYRDFEIDIRISGGTDISEQPPASRLDGVIRSTVVNPDQFDRFGVARAPRALYKPATDIFDEFDTWIKIEIGQGGVTRITGTALQQAGVDLNDLESGSLRLFYAGGEIPYYDNAEPELYQIPVGMYDGGDGSFDAGDYFLFYAEAVSGYDYADGFPEYRHNAYEDDNCYWLAVGGEGSVPVLRWQSRDSRPEGPYDHLVRVTRQQVRVEEDHLIKVDPDGRIYDYATWYWSDQSDISAAVNLPRTAPGDSISIELTAYCDYTLSSISLNGVPLTRSSISGRWYYWDNAGAAAAGINDLRMTIRQSYSRTPYMDHLDVDYPMELRYDNRQMEFNSYGYTGLLRYGVTGYSAGLVTLDITDPNDPLVMTGHQLSGDTVYFERQSATDEVARFVVFDLADAGDPLAVEAEEMGDLRTDLGPYDCLIISPRSFQGALQEYVTYRQATEGVRIKLVAVEDIYNRFGFGLESPMAIRSYCKFAYEQYDDPAPYAVLLVGDGHYDYHDNLGLHAPSYIPSFVWGKEGSGGDDNYVYFGDLYFLDSDSSYIYAGDRGWDMMVARWPVRSSSEVRAYIEKLKAYDSPDNRGFWRSVITYVADDEWKKGYSNEIIHTRQSESLAVYHTPVDYVRQKIYATEYPFASSGEKPTVNEAIVKSVNEGTLILNYIGHGSPEVWADEHILKKAVDLGRMKNEEKPFVVIAGSCSIGKFDVPSTEGMAELMFRSQGGAIATVSATRLVYANNNAMFNYAVYDAIFDGYSNVCEAVYAVKLMHQYEMPYNISLLTNDRKYVVFGDPLGRLGLPQYGVEFDSGPDSVLTPLEAFDFSGRVVDGDGDPVTADGVIDINVYDSRIVKHHPEGIDYSLEGPSVFRGPVAVAGGEFAGTFIVPLDIDYGGREARISGFGNLGGMSALGARDSVAIAESAGTTSDNAGPEIGFYFEEAPEFVSGDRIPANATLVLELFDNSGINVTGGLGHRIELTVDNDNNSTVNLTDMFVYNTGDYRRGTLRYTLPDLTPESHRFAVKAWDNANNPSIEEFDATPSQESRIALHNVMNFPNPMEETTEFYFELSESAQWVELKIFTLAGRLIKRFHSENLQVGRNRRFLWDGRDLDGDRVAEGVYLYKITAGGRVASQGGSADNMAEKYGKLILLN